MTKFTEGPWSIDQYGAIVDKNGETIRVRAIVSIPMSMSVPIGDEARPNAYLFAAAPRLYAVTEKLIEALETLVGDCPEVERGRLALAEARGES